MMQEKYLAFFKKWNGRPCEVNDPSNLNQCMDLAYAWCDALGVSRDAIRHLYASEIYSKPNDITVKYFEMIPNTTLAVPQVGDIVVFKGTPGHVSVANGVGDTNAFQSFDQNWGATVGKCGLITHAYDNVAGFLRFRITPVLEITDQTLLPIINAEGQQLEVQAVRSLIADQSQTIVNLRKDIESLVGMIDTLNKQIDELKLLPISSQITLNQIHSVLYGSGFWWTKWAKIKLLVPKE